MLSINRKYISFIILIVKCFKVEERFGAIMAPIEARKSELMKKKEAFQFKRDVEDETLWIEEKMVVASSQEVVSYIFYQSIYRSI